MVTPGEVFGDLVLTVYNDSGHFVLHTDGYTMPPNQGHTRRKAINEKKETSIKFNKLTACYLIIFEMLLHVVAVGILT